MQQDGLFQQDDDMKMVKRGAVPVIEEMWTGECHYCKSEYEASREELRRCQVGTTGPHVLYSVCEVCKRIVYFKKLVPMEMQRDVLLTLIEEVYSS